MTTPVRYYSYNDDLASKAFNLKTDVFKVALTNTAPALTDTTWSTGTYPAPAAANGYTAGGNTITTSSASTTSGVFKLVLADSTFTATAGGIGPFRYAIVYNSTASNKLCWYFDYGSSITLADTEPFVVDHDATTGAYQLS